MTICYLIYSRSGVNLIHTASLKILLVKIKCICSRKLLQWPRRKTFWFAAHSSDALGICNFSRVCFSLILNSRWNISLLELQKKVINSNLLCMLNIALSLICREIRLLEMTASTCRLSSAALSYSDTIECNLGILQNKWIKTIF